MENIFLFNGVDKNIIKYAIADSGYKKMKYIAGDMIFDSNNYIKALGYIIRGKILIEKNNIPLKISGTGEVFGAASLFIENENDGYVTQIKAKTKCEILFIEESLLCELIKIDSAVAINYIKFLSQKIRYLNNKIDSFTSGTAESKLLKFLYSEYNEHKSVVITDINYKNLASSLDIGRASLYRAIDNFVKQKLIIKNNKQIILTDINKIQTIIK